MDKQPTESFRAGLASSAALPGILIIDEPAYYPDTQHWVIHCRITVSVPPDSPIPASTHWYVLIDDHYPHGCISIHPAKDGGITQTFPHQNYNGKDNAHRPWRTGKLCTCCGTTEIKTMEPGSSIAIVTRFNNKKSPRPIEQEWRKSIGNGEIWPVFWIRMFEVPVLPPWPMPATWGELWQVCKSQSINLGDLLRNAIGAQPVSNRPLLLGFPIPNKIRGPNLRDFATTKKADGKRTSTSKSTILPF